MTKEWLKKILTGEKRLMKLSELKPVHVGYFPEVSVKQLYSDFSSRSEMEPYLPEKIPKGKQLDKTYFFNIANTLFEKEIQAII